MKIAKNIKELNSLKGDIRPLGFVPTMGALHNGHLSLVNEALLRTPLTIISIFVNPTQFNDKNDLKNYPRDLQKDLKNLDQVLRDNDIVYVPEEKEIYPEPDNRIFDFGHLDKIMEGKNRPGHFNGVGQVVSKLFGIVKPDLAFFGEKDLQQLAIIQKLVEMLKIQVTVIGIPIVRESDGLAMSSRNQLLGENERKAAPEIYKSLREAANLHKKEEIDKIKEKTIQQINKNPYLSVEYFEIVDETNLLPVKSWDEATGIYGCIAVRAGRIRLIDNIRFL
jgi:pantoate--beta-alanine ligase